MNTTDPRPGLTAQQKTYIQEILETAQETMDKLTILENKLQSEITRINMIPYVENREITATEKQVRSKRITQIKIVRAEKSKIAVEAAEALDTAPETQALLAQMKATNDALQDTLSDLSKVVGYAKTAAEVLAGIATMTAELVKLAAVLA